MVVAGGVDSMWLTTNSERKSAVNAPTAPSRMIQPKLEREIVTLFSQIEQQLDLLRKNRSPLQPLGVIEALQQIVELNVNFADRNLASRLSEDDCQPLLGELSQFFSMIAPLKKSLRTGRWLSMLGFGSQRSSLAIPAVSEAFVRFLRKGVEMVQSYFRLYADPVNEVRPDRKWLEIAAGSFVGLNQTCQGITRDLGFEPEIPEP
jgi:hypothetical protein